MLQFQDTDNTNQDISTTDSGIFFPQSVLNNVSTDWNINESESLCLQGNTSQDKEFNFGSFQCNCNSLPTSFSDSSWNMGFQFGGNQYTASPCCLFEQQTKKQMECAPPPILSDIEPFIGIDIENRHIDYGVIPGKQGSSSNSGDCRLLNCMQIQQPSNLPMFNSPFRTQDSTLFQYNSNNPNGYNYCLETDCVDKLCSPSKSQYSSCILEQNLDITSIRTENLPRVNDCTPDLSFIPLDNDDDTILNVNESDEDSDIIVEDSDTESEVSIDVGPYISDKEVEKQAVMRCFVCNLSYSEKVDFVQVNSSFPLTFVSQTPVMLKLIEIIPIDMQTSVKFENNLICKRCLNLIDMIENLEVRLVSVKKAICDFVSRSSKDVIDEDWNMLQASSDICMDDNIVKIEPLMSKQVKKDTDTTEKIATEEILEVNIGENLNKHWSTDIDKNQTTQNEDANFSDNILVNGINNNLDKTIITDINKVSNLNGSTSLIISDNVNRILTESKKEHKLTDESLSKKSNDENSNKIGHESKTNKHFKEGKHQCDRCGKLYRYENDLKDHLKKHEGDFIEKCTDCGKGFIKKRNLEIHMRKHRNHICVNCRASFVSDVELVEHTKKCTENNVSCPECKLIFSSETKLKNHVKKHKVVSNMCTICNKSFKHPSYLVAHMKSHSDEKPFTCEKCGRCYKNQNHLRRHMKSHDSSLKCLKCSKVFPSILELKTHLRIHVEAVECDICKKSVSKDHLIEHQKIHKNTKRRVECPVCKKMITNNLKVHMSKHSEVREYKCEICSVEFTFKHSLTKHMRLKHKVS